ncbi:MAG: hypothetical protein KAS80_04455 [Anaerolineales bacterium]|nr:hypothetical protein [Anaerolineales bacterium]
MDNKIPVLLMLPPKGSSEAEAWVAAGRLAAACDLAERIKANPLAGPCFLLAHEESDRPALQEMGFEQIQSSVQPFHFGDVLAEIISEYHLDRLAYFGGASAPLMGEKDLQQVFEQILRQRTPTAVVNNLYSSDWAVFNHTRVVEDIKSKLPSDNPLGWVMQQEAQFDVRALPPSASSRLDIDTPTDLVLLHGHPGIGRHCREFLHHAAPPLLDGISNLRRVLQTPASTLSIIGRASSAVWKELEERTKIWVRIYVEERGMVASQRLARGEVRSLIADMVNELQPSGFLTRLGQMSDAVIWDTRVWMGSMGSWPSPADRFAADLGWADQISDEALRNLTVAIMESPIPVVAGGHGVVAGGLLALLETL